MIIAKTGCGTDGALLSTSCSVVPQCDPAATISVTLDIWYVPSALPWDSYNLLFYLETEEAKMKLHFIDKLQNID